MSGVESNTRDWRPHPGPQTFLLKCAGCFEILFGGARGGGKTAGGQAWLTRPPHFGNPLYRALVMRRNYEDLCDWLDRARRIYADLGGHVVASGKARVEFETGEIFRCGHLKDKEAYTKFQGHEYQRLLIEEAGQIPDESRYELLLGSCRSTVPGLETEVLLTANPGGVGHRWLKERFGCGKDDPREPNKAYRGKDGRLRMYIPATVDDNPSIQIGDPKYIAWLEALPEPFRSAWRYGDWDIYSGQAFEWTSGNVVDPCPVPAGARVIQTFDWGFGKPFSVGWWWVTADAVLVRIGEWYGCTPGQRDMGLRLADHEIAAGILHREADMGVTPSLRLADPTIFNRKPDSKGGGLGDSTATVFQRCGLAMRPGDAARKLKFRQFGARIKTKTLVVFRTCREFIRTVPDLPLDERTYDDVDTDSEDHIYDEACHACMEVGLPDAALRASAGLPDALAVGRAGSGASGEHGRIRAGSLAEILRRGARK
ncbi:MAG: Terminase-like family protein [Kiritimatiellae bacterium]|nr:Terminase-like family protein [Kiritimatiellia bacterium]